MTGCGHNLAFTTQFDEKQSVDPSQPRSYCYAVRKQLLANRPLRSEHLASLKKKDWKIIEAIHQQKNINSLMKEPLRSS